MLNEKIAQLKKMIIEESLLSQEMVKNSIKALVEKTPELLDNVISSDEHNLNQMEIEIEQFCINLIAKYQPEAGNLRTIVMVLKMNNDLERIGDLAVNIAESAKYLIQRPQVKPLIDIPRMAEESIGMLKDAVTAFIEQDANLAKNVCERDGIVDNLRNQILRELITFMTSDPRTIERSLHLIRISRNLERIADLSTNIGEDVIFMVQGRIIKHHLTQEP